MLFISFCCTLCGISFKVVDFSVMVLTAGSWPLTGMASSEFQLPEEVS